MPRPLLCAIFYLFLWHVSWHVSAEPPVPVTPGPIVSGPIVSGPLASGPFAYSHAVANVAYERLASKTLGRDFHLMIRLPDNYAQTTKSFPVVYLLDGGATFPALAGYYHYLSLEAALPDLIIVGISYGTASFQKGNMRSTDYTVASAERDYWGGAPKFQTVLNHEIVPVIEKRFRADAGQRVLFGQSIAGQFVLFNALTEPDRFLGHIASNPALHRNLSYFLGDFPATTGSTRLYLASGSDDESRFREPALKFMDHWQRQKNRPFHLHAESLEGYGHFSILTESFRRGLTYIFMDKGHFGQRSTRQ